MKRILIALALLLTCACGKIVSPSGGDDVTGYVNIFAYNTMRIYYLWADEIADKIADWKMNEEPVAKVKSLRYKDTRGNEIDHWTELYENFDDFYGVVSGNRLSYGFEYKLFYGDKAKTRVVAPIIYTYAGSPARAAGLQRGQCIVKVNGKVMTPDNYQEISMNELRGGEHVTLTFSDGTEKTLAAAQLYEDPMLETRVFDCGGKAVGYLHYTSFTLDSCEDLIRVCKEFKEQGVRELILDLRYNNGGYAFTEELFASMLAPEADVAAGHILTTEVFNSRITKELGKQETPFRTEFTIESDGQKHTFDTREANLGIDRLYAIVDSGSASASESLLCELYPYLDITLVGGQTRGKYCSGLMIRAEKWYETNADELGDEAKGIDFVKGWGIYVMYSRFADKDGVTRCMPDGLKPDRAVADDPSDGYALGDPRETMLAATLALAGYPAAAPSAAPRSLAPAPVALPSDRPAARVAIANSL